jgi:hypothetical protein
MDCGVHATFSANNLCTLRYFLASLYLVDCLAGAEGSTTLLIFILGLSAVGCGCLVWARAVDKVCLSLWLADASGIGLTFCILLVVLCM